MSRPEFSSDHYERIHYRCRQCGRSESFAGSPVRRRNPIREEADCTICEMELTHPKRYWSGDLTPDRVIVWEWPTNSRATAGGSP